MAEHLPDRQPAHDRIAELAPLKSRSDGGQIGADRIDHGRARQQCGKLVELIGGRAACQSARGFSLMKAARDFLQAQDVEIAQSPCLAHDAGEVDAAIHAASPLYVPVDESHDVLLRKACGQSTAIALGSSVPRVIFKTELTS